MGRIFATGDRGHTSLDGQNVPVTDVTLDETLLLTSLPFADTVTGAFAVIFAVTATVTLPLHMPLPLPLHLPLFLQLPLALPLIYRYILPLLFPLHLPFYSGCYRFRTLPLHFPLLLVLPFPIFCRYRSRYRYIFRCCRYRCRRCFRCRCRCCIQQGRLFCTFFVVASCSRIMPPPL